MIDLPSDLAQAMGKKKVQRDWRPLIFIGLGAMNVLSFILVFAIYGRVSHIVATQRPTLVQLSDGSAVRVKMGSSISREPETIDRFVREILPLGMNWSEKLPDGSEDTGIPVGNAMVPTPLWVMSATMESEFRAGWLGFMAENLDSQPVLSGQEQRLLKIRDVSSPQEIEPGLWAIDLISDWYWFTAKDRKGSAVPFNKRLILKAVPPQLSPLQEKASPLEKALYRVQSAGLEIIDIQELL